jgi:twitching motility protein PilT
VAICEVLKMTGRIRDMVMDPEMTGGINDAIAEGGFYGMQTFDQALYECVRDERVDMDVALRYATKVQDFKLLVAAEGKIGTSMDDVRQDEEEIDYHADLIPEPEAGSLIPEPEPVGAGSLIPTA